MRCFANASFLCWKKSSALASHDLRVTGQRKLLGRNPVLATLDRLRKP